MTGAHAAFVVAGQELARGTRGARSLVPGAALVLVAGLLALDLLAFGPGASAPGEGAATDEARLLAFSVALAIVASVLGLLATLDAVSGTRASGEMEILLAKPMPALSFLLGTYAGRSLALLLPTVLALGAGLAVAPGGRALGARVVASILLLALLMVLAFLSAGLLVSVLAPTPAASLLSAVSIWVTFASPVWEVVRVGAEAAGLPPSVAAILNPAHAFVAGALDAAAPGKEDSFLVAVAVLALHSVLLVTVASLVFRRQGALRG